MVLGAEILFYQSKDWRKLGSSVKKSARKVSDIDLVDEQELREAYEKLEFKHEKEINALVNSYKKSYAEWVFMLRCGFGLLMYGFGSKKALIEDFASTALTDYSVVVINVYLQSINLKQAICIHCWILSFVFCGRGRQEQRRSS